MKNLVLALSVAAPLLLAGCAGVKVVDTQVASGAANPRAIYIRPFDASGADYVGQHRGGKGERPIRQSLAGRQFANDLKNELEKLAPAMVIESDERPVEGWVVEGTLDVVHGGSAEGRAVPIADTAGLGQSHVKIHVRIRDLGGNSTWDDKDSGKLSRRGNVIYEFDLAGGSHGSGRFGSIYAPGFGEPEPFDFKNAAERVMMALSTDPHREGLRTSPVIR